MTHKQKGQTNRSAPRKAFLAFLGTVGLLYLGLVIYHIAIPELQATGTEKLSALEQCRQFCKSYGLLPTGHIATDAENYLAAARSRKLTVALESILSDKEFVPTETQFHDLLEQPAPSFVLKDHTGQERSSAEWFGKRPTVVVFYYGYGCSHCVAQLFAIDKDLALFRELGAEVIAISTDTPEHTTERYKEYGAFHFPVLSDLENQASKSFGVFRPKTADKPESQDHGTFIVDPQGRVVWADFGPEPFLDNRSLLHILNKTVTSPANATSASTSN